MPDGGNAAGHTPSLSAGTEALRLVVCPPKTCQGEYACWRGANMFLEGVHPDRSGCRQRCAGIALIRRS